MAGAMFLSAEQQRPITDAIAAAERLTSGEIRVHIEARCKADVMDRAAFVFDKLAMQKTELRNGVLFYLASESRKVAVLGDAGIHAAVPENFWDDVLAVLKNRLAQNDAAGGLVEGIRMAGEQLAQFFPVAEGDVNELTDDISFGA